MLEGSGLSYDSNYSIEDNVELPGYDLESSYEANFLDDLGYKVPEEISGYLPNYNPKTGDVVVIQPYPGGNKSGHMAMFDGKIWISDFKQRGIWAGPGYRKFKPSYIIYRYPSSN